FARANLVICVMNSIVPFFRLTNKGVASSSSISFVYCLRGITFISKVVLILRFNSVKTAFSSNNKWVRDATDKSLLFKFASAGDGIENVLLNPNSGANDWVTKVLYEASIAMANI